jgi:hypothetical protein
MQAAVIAIENGCQADGAHRNSCGPTFSFRAPHLGKNRI